MKFLIKCPECGSTEHITSIRRVLMENNDSIEDWLTPPIDAAYCTECKIEIGIGHLVKVNDDAYLEIDFNCVDIVDESSEE